MNPQTFQQPQNNMLYSQSNSMESLKPLLLTSLMLNSGKNDNFMTMAWSTRECITRQQQ